MVFPRALGYRVSGSWSLKQFRVCVPDMERAFIQIGHWLAALTSFEPRSCRQDGYIHAVHTCCVYLWVEGFMAGLVPGSCHWKPARLSKMDDSGFIYSITRSPC